MGRLFGTDGIRGIANADLDAQLAFSVGQAAAAVLSKGKNKRPFITIGKDTRISSDMLEAALIAGICSSGADVMPLGVVPTPAVAYITRVSGADAGIVISASHNPYEYNGIKIFNSQGFKLSDELELEIERLVLSDTKISLKKSSDMGRVVSGSNRYLQMYVDKLASLSEDIAGYKVIIDCANGATARTAEMLFSRLPVELTLISDKPNGTNINDCCGSTNTEALSKSVISSGADIGIAFDGDGDRCIIVDENGNIVDGDRIMAICGYDMKKKGKLKNNTIVATVYSNLGFRVFAENNDIKLVAAAVGDRNVLEMMQKVGANLGGEQSGHLIFLDDASTGDGQLAALKFLNVLASSQKTVSELVAQVPQYPQLLRSIPIEGGNAVKEAVMANEALKKCIRDAEKELGDTGRVLVRPSGTEALIRVMVEARDESKAETIACRLVDFIKNQVCK
ncbi:MAG: phosphoglucosamine mutase [Clostridiales bacterium]|nr:phosphoglucosamine mutase [Clostridiales bacterium]